MAEDSREQWERRYEASLAAEDERYGRVPGKFDIYTAQYTFAALFASSALVAVGVGVLGSKVGIPYWVGAGITIVVLGATAGVGIYRWWRHRGT